MLCFPNCKINLGLSVTSKRADGFHSIESVFYPLDLADVLEIVPSDNAFSFENSGITIDCSITSNLCYKAYNLLKQEYSLPPIEMHLHKIIPSGAGLGGGSSDAASTIILLNDIFSLQLSNEKMREYARSLGSDCAFFIENKAVYAYNKGDEFKPIDIDLSAYTIVIVKPPIHVSTADAYSGIIPALPENPVQEIIKQDVTNWKDVLHNDFEDTIFPKYPEIKAVKDKLYDLGAVYASMSGSGAAVYGIFTSVPQIRSSFPEDYFISVPSDKAQY